MDMIGKLELVRESLVAVVKEMRANIIHSSYSSIIYEGHDFSCALMAADGRLVAQSLDDNPIHIFPVPFSTREIVNNFKNDINPGDIFLHNDPYTGGTHLNDVLMLCPIFVEEELLLFAAMRCHWGDVGGMTPGSLSGRAIDILQEGIRIVPTKICEQGRMNEAALSFMFNNMRSPAERRGDFNTMLGAGRKAAQHIERLARRFGTSDLMNSIDELIRRSEQVMRNRIRECPSGVYYSDGYIESDGYTGEPLAARLKLTIEDDRLIADFTGTSPQAKGPTNAGASIAFNAVCTIVKAFLDPHTSINHGSFQPVEVIAPEGTFINARPPAPCGGMAEVKALLDSLVVGALGQAIPEMMVGGLKGSANHVMLSGTTVPHGSYLLYEYPAAGTGASLGTDGSNVVRAFSDGDFNSVQSTEIIESALPLRVERYGIREGSCGDGQYRGGFGMHREIRVLQGTGSLSVLSERNVIPPFGVMGGFSGAPNQFNVRRNGQIIAPSKVPGKVADFPIMEGDVLIMQTSGGGGYGDPLERDPARVSQDVKLGYLSRASARARYGVVLTDDLRIDPATDAERQKLRARRVLLQLRLVNRFLFDGPRRLFEVPRSKAAQISIADNSIIEVITGRGQSLRGWTRLTDGDDRELCVDTSTLSILASSPGDRVEIRPLSSSVA